MTRGCRLRGGNAICSSSLSHGPSHGAFVRRSSLLLTYGSCRTSFIPPLLTRIKQFCYIPKVSGSFLQLLFSRVSSLYKKENPSGKFLPFKKVFAF